MSAFEVLSCVGRDAARWQSFVDRLAYEHRDIMFTPAYARVQQSLGQGDCFAAVYQWQEFFILQPFMKRGQELTSFYGGGGPISNLMGKADYRLWLWFEQDFAEWRKENKITSEYVRLHPIFQKQQRRMLCESTLDVELLREAVVVNIDQSDEKLLKSFSRNRQRGVKESTAIGVGKSCDTDLFYDLYKESMFRLGAPLTWAYEKSVWVKYLAELEGQVSLLKQEKTVYPQPMLLVLHAFGKAYAHFIGTPPGANTDFLYYESMKYCRDVGCKTYFLGGGTTSNADDPLLAYKSGFSKERVPVYFYRRDFICSQSSGTTNAVGHQSVTSLLADRPSNS